MFSLPPPSRLWVFQANRLLDACAVALIQREMTSFTASWTSHDKPLHSDFAVQKNAFLLVGADVTKAGPSGCSIDALHRQVATLGASIKVDFFDRLTVAYEDSSGQLQLVSVATFEKRLREGQANASTIVYNTLVQTVADLEENWRTTVRRSWHHQLLEST